MFSFCFVFVNILCRPEMPPRYAKRAGLVVVRMPLILIGYPGRCGCVASSGNRRHSDRLMASKGPAKDEALPSELGWCWSWSV